MSPLNENQVRRVLSTFAHVDGLLRDVERVSRNELSPFAKERADFAPDEARLMRSFVETARARMLAALDRLGLPRPAPSTSARWSATTALTFADIALSEITEESLRGYGRVDAAAARELVALTADLRALVARGKSLLHEHDPEGLAERLAAVPGVAGEVLRAVEALSTERGMAELRPLLAAAAERALAGTFDVGVFGHVSAGKSSLINTLIGAPVLPVGATPVTAVPIRIAHGEPGAGIHLLDGGSLSIPIDAIAEYATEARNPRNGKGVRAIELTAPGVPRGLRFVDTPGVGSLGSSGPAQSFAWLPRCDLGLVLIAAGTAAGRDDLALVAGLARAGIACRVLLSKADVLAADELQRSLAYVRDELASVLGPEHDVGVLPVSSIAGHEAQLEELRANVLAPLAADHERAATDALRVRLHRLVAAAGAALDGAGEDAPPLDVYRARAAAEDVIRREADRIANAAGAIIHETAEAVLAAWRGGADGKTAARASIVKAGARSLEAVREAVDGARASIGAEESSRERRIPPLFDPEFLDALPPLDVPSIGWHVLGRRIALARLDPVAAPLSDALTRYAARLYAWGMAQLETLAEPVGGEKSPMDGGRPELARLDELIDSIQRDAVA